MSLSRDRIREIQTEKLRSLLATLAESNAFYRRKLAGLSPKALAAITLDRLTDLPLTTKEDLVEDQRESPPYGTNLTYPLERYVRLHSTSGTTGDPLRWLDTAASWSWFLECWRAVLTDAGVRADDRVFLAFSFGPFIGFWGAFEAAQEMGALSLTGGALSTEQRLEHLLDNRATVLVSTPTYALRLAEVARQRGIDLASSEIRLTINAGEPGASVPNVKQRIEEAWGAICIDHAGATEVGAWGVTARGDGMMRILETEFLAEVLETGTDEPATADRDGVLEGELVLTNLGRLGSPVVRYRTGDLVAMIPASADQPYSRLRGGILARVDGMVVVRGVNVYPSAIENLVRAFPEIDEFQVTVRRVDEMSELEIEIEVTRGDPAEVAKRLEDLIRRRLSLRAVVAVRKSGSLPRYELKAKRFRMR